MVVHQLLSKGAAVDFKDVNGRTPLSCGVKRKFYGSPSTTFKRGRSGELSALIFPDAEPISLVHA